MKKQMTVQKRQRGIASVHGVSIDTGEIFSGTNIIYDIKTEERVMRLFGIQHGLYFEKDEKTGYWKSQFNQYFTIKWIKDVR